MASENHEVPRNKASGRLRLHGLIEALTGRRSKDTAPATNYDEIDAYYKEQRRQKLDQRPAGPGLKEYDVNLDLFQYSTDAAELSSRPTEFFRSYGEVMDRYRQEGKDIEDQFHNDSEEHPFESLMMSSAAQSRPTEQLSRWLEAHIPQNGYFTPEMIIESVADNPSVSVDHEVANGIETWIFSNDQDEHFSLSRPEDARRPTVRTKPYLAVRYSPEYDFDTKEVLVEPKLGLNGYEQQELAALKGDLGDTIKASLGIEPARISQELSFSVVDARPVPYLASADPRSLESITAQAYVVADLPHENTQD